MNNQLTNFIGDHGEITVLTKDDGTIWFHAGQLLANTGTKTTTAQAKTAIEERLGKGYNILIPLQTVGGTQEVLFFAEAAATWYLSRSRTAAGKALDRKIHTEILPQIHKTGVYQPKPEPTAQPKVEPLPSPIKTVPEMFVMAGQALMEHQAQIQELQVKVGQMEAICQQATREMLALPEATVATPVLVTRRAILKAVNNYCTAKNIEQRTAWNLLYEELRLRCGVAVKLRAKVSPQETYLDVAVRLGYGDSLYAIALDLFGINKETLREYH